MAQETITKRLIEALQKRSKTQERTLYLYDAQMHGLGLYATPKGRVTWFVQKWSDGKPEKFNFAHWPALPIDEARTEGGEHLTAIKRGSTARDLRRARTPKRSLTLQQASEEYLEAKAGEGEYWRETRRKFTRDIPPRLKSTPIDQITKGDLKTLLDAKDGTSAPRYLYAVLSAFLNWCVEKDYLPASPLVSLTPPEKCAVRERVLSDPELKAIWNASLGDELFGPFYRLLMLTAQRREEVGALEWSEIEGAIWTIPAHKTKNGKEHIVHLSPQALAIIAKITKTKSPYLFTTTGETPISGYAKAKRRIDRALGAKFKPWRVHDLRRTAATGMQSLGVAPQVIEKVLNHELHGILKHYQQFPYLDERLKALDAWGRYVARLVSGRHS